MIKKIVTICILVFSTIQSWAIADLPVETTAIDPPPDTAPIDLQLPFVLFISIVLACYYLIYREKSTPSKQIK
jgi:hypothetical protein